MSEKGHREGGGGIVWEGEEMCGEKIGRRKEKKKGKGGREVHADTCQEQNMRKIEV